MSNKAVEDFISQAKGAVKREDGSDDGSRIGRDQERLERDRERVERRSRDPRDNWDRGGDRDRNRDSNRDRYNNRERGGDRDRDRNRDNGRNRDRYRDNDRERDRYRGGRDHYRDNRDNRDSRDRYRDNERDSRDRYRGRDRDHNTSKRKRDRESILESLANVVPINERKRRNTQWDIFPPGYENVSIEMAKASGLFPTALDILKLHERKDDNKNEGPQLLMPPPPPPSRILQNGNNEENITAQNSRLARSIIISDYDPNHHTIESLTKLFITLILSISNIEIKDKANTIKDCFYALNTDNSKAIIEFSDSNLATIAVAYDGLPIDDEQNEKFTITRPQGYIVPQLTDKQVESREAVKDKINKSSIPDNPLKGVVANIPTFLNEDQILELLTAFGGIKSFHLLTDAAGNSRGTAFFEYNDSNILEIACQGLNNMKLGENALVVKFACIGHDQGKAIVNLESLVKLCQDHKNNQHPSTTVMQIWNAVTPEELADDLDIAEISTQIEEECLKFGEVVSVKIPKDTTSSNNSLAASLGGKVYVKFANSKCCQEAVKHLAGRKFTDRTIISAFYDEESFNLGIF